MFMNINDARRPPACLFQTNIIQNEQVSFTHNPPPSIRPSDFRLSYEPK